MPKLIGRILTITCLVLVLVGGLLFYAYRSTQTGPRFYRQALQADRGQQAIAGDQFEDRVLQLHNSARRQGRWEMTLTEDQINGWLAVDLPERFPGTLPDSVSKPRVSITEDAMHIAFRFVHPRFSGVVSCRVDAYVTQQENVIGLQINNLRCGITPLPLSRVTDAVNSAARQSNTRVTWSNAHGSPLALLHLPDRFDDEPQQKLTIETIRLGDKSLYISGRTTSRSPQDNP